ncbi:MAG: hypothetical protein ACRENN_10805 [Candidatus Eiseniibacteriota bacterium]
MADVMEERVRSIQLCAGVTFALSALILSICLALYPTLAPAHQTNLILDAISKQDVGGWMWLHAWMVTGFLLATVGFTALAFLLHLRGSSGAASITSVSALVGGGIWATFLSMELFVAPFLKLYYPIDPGLATMLFATVWFWKMGALAVGAVLLFTAVIAAGTAGVTRDVMPVWMGWGGALFGGVGILVYLFEFWTTTATGLAINPMRNAGMRYGVGLPIQLWMIGVGATLLREWRMKSAALPPQMRTHVPPKREVRHETKVDPKKKPVGSLADFPPAPPLPPPIP